MKGFYIYIVVGLSIFLMYGCFPEDERVLPDRTFTTVALLNDYSQCQYYQLAADSVVKTTINTTWDLGFACADTSQTIVLNTANFMFAALTDLSGIDEIIDINQPFDWKWDSPDGNADSTALREWPLIIGRIYLISRGELIPKYVKVRFDEADETTYRFTYQFVGETTRYNGEVIRDSAYHYMHYSFGTHTSLAAEPPKDSWDILFTRYTYIFYQSDPDAPIPFTEPYLPYSVVGAFTNSRSGVLTAEDREGNFDEVLASDTAQYTFSTDRDIIGWNWKVFNFSSYSIVQPLFFYRKGHRWNALQA